MVRIITGHFKGHKLKSNKKSTVRPTKDRVKESLFGKLLSLEGSLLGKTVIDLFAGTGNLGFEALSRGADHVTFVEKNKRQAQLIEQNARMLGICEKIDIINGDVIAYLRHNRPRVDIIFADPPYTYTRLEDLLDVFKELVSESWIVMEMDRYTNIDGPIKSRIITEKQFGKTKIIFFRMYNNEDSRLSRDF